MFCIRMDEIKTLMSKDTGEGMDTNPGVGYLSTQLQ